MRLWCGIRPGHSTVCSSSISIILNASTIRQGTRWAMRFLSEVGSALRQAVRTGDAVARLGGDEFGVLLANVEPQVAGAIVERLRSRISVSVGIIEGITVSQPGYVCFTAGKGFDEQAIMVAADSALREAKLAGRDQAVAATLAN